MSKKKGAKGMPSDGPGKHDPSKPVKSDKVDYGFDKTARSKRYEGPQKTKP
ncbi:MAG TPA: hypothetical protein PKK11_03845 [Methanothrix sp.]|nr:hypothetical protein [Methanothrix sp.]HPT20239.1 hypothetical protein [Methanothrix sp.]